MSVRPNVRPRCKPWLLVTATVVVICCCLPLAMFWFKREKIEFYFTWDPGIPISQNLSCFEWGGEHSTIIDPDDGGPGYIGTTHREWCVGPFEVTKVIYERP